MIKEYDICICGWGGAIGKNIEIPNTYAMELYIKINNIKYKRQILDLIKNAKWKEIYKMTTVPTLKNWQIYKYIYDNIPELKEINKNEDKFVF